MGYKISDSPIGRGSGLHESQWQLGRCKSFGKCGSLKAYLLIPWDRVLLEKLTGFAANREIPRLLWNPKVHYRTHKRPPPVIPGA